MILVKILISLLVALALANFILFRFFVSATQQTVLIVAAANLVYFVVAYFVHPVPNETEVEWEGTI